MAEVPDTPLDVAEILTRLRAEVRTRRQALLSAEETDPTRSAIERQLQRSAETLEITRVVSAHWPLESRSPVQRGVHLVNKVVRRFLRWYINPIVEQQNAFNDTATRTLRLLVEGYNELLYQQDQPPQSPADSSPAQAPAADTPEPAADAPTSEIQQQVETRGHSEPPALFPDLVFRATTARLAQQQAVVAHWPLPADTLPQRFAALVHKATRRYLRWLINPIVEQQNAFNAALSDTAAALLTADTEARVREATQRARRARMHKPR